MKILFFLIALSTTLLAVEFHVDKERENQVKFISEAPLEDIVGVTDKIDGYILWEKDDLISQSEFYFEVDLASIDTGIGLRNRHMQENYLETDEYPYVSYAGKILYVEDKGGDSLAVRTAGVFKLHGVEKDVEIPGIVYKLNNGYKASSRFEIKLEDYNIERPQLMLLKIGEVIQLDIQFYAKEYKE